MAVDVAAAAAADDGVAVVGDVGVGCVVVAAVVVVGGVDADVDVDYL